MFNQACVQPITNKITGFFSGLENFKAVIRKRRRNKFLSFLIFPEKGALLDLSCGNGYALEIFHRHAPSLEFYGIDMSEEVVTRAKANYPWGKFSVARVESLPYSDQTFSVITSFNSFHHYDKPGQVFKEAARVLSPTGTLYIIDIFPKYCWLQWIFNNWDRCCEPYHFEKYYTKEDIKLLATGAGFFVASYVKTGWLSDTKIIALKKIP